MLVIFTELRSFCETVDNGENVDRLLLVVSLLESTGSVSITLLIICGVLLAYVLEVDDNGCIVGRLLLVVCTLGFATVVYIILLVTFVFISSAAVAVCKYFWVVSSKAADSDAVGNVLLVVVVTSF